MKITKFVKGDIIIRNEPAIQYRQQYNSSLGIMEDVEVCRSNSFMDKPVKFLALQNGKIFIEHLEKFWRNHAMPKAILSEYEYEFGWEHFSLPEGFSWEDVGCVNPNELT